MSEMRAHAGEFNSRRRMGARGGAGARENRVEHVAGDATGECVLLARVVAPDEQRVRSPWGTQLHLGAVPERGPRPWRLVACARQRLPEGLPGETTEAHDHPQTGSDQAQLRGEPGRAVITL